MANTVKNKKEEKDKSQPVSKPETEHTADPQDQMKGPVSSFMQNIKEEANKNDKVSKEEADRKRDEHL